MQAKQNKKEEIHPVMDKAEQELSKGKKKSRGRLVISFLTNHS